jgi:acylphosphatase
VTVRLLISGRVQGVGFRYFVLRRAQAAGLAGFTRNLADGSVEVVAEGSQEQLEALEAAVRRGPPHAHVSRVEKTEISDEVDIPKTFDIR